MQWSRYGFPVHSITLHNANTQTRAQTHTHMHTVWGKNCYLTKSMQRVKPGIFLKIDSNSWLTQKRSPYIPNRLAHANRSLSPTIQTCGWLDARWSIPRGVWWREGWGWGGDRPATTGAAWRLWALLGRFLFLHPGEFVGQGTDRDGRSRGLAGRAGLLDSKVMRLVAISGRGSPVLLAPSSWFRLAGCARAEAGYGVLEGRRNYCRLLDWWSLKWLQDGREGCQALCKGRLAVYKPDLPLKFKIHSFLKPVSPSNGETPEQSLPQNKKNKNHTHAHSHMHTRTRNNMAFSEKINKLNK